MTPRHITNQDRTLIRPGRVGHRVRLGWTDAGEAMFLRFFPGDNRLAAKFRKHLAEGQYSPADLQGWLLANATDAEVAAEAEALQRPLSVAAE